MEENRKKWCLQRDEASQNVTVLINGLPVTDLLRGEHL